MQRNLKQFTSYFVEIVMFVCYVYFNEIAGFVLLSVFQMFLQQNTWLLIVGYKIRGWLYAQVSWVKSLLATCKNYV